MKVYGAGYRDGWPTLIAVVWTAAILAVSTPVGDVITASGRMWLGLLMNSGWAVVFISSTYLLVHLGSLGLASSRLIAYAVHAVWTMGFAYMIIRERTKQEKQEKEGPKDSIPQLQETIKSGPVEGFRSTYGSRPRQRNSANNWFARARVLAGRASGGIAFREWCGDACPMDTTKQRSPDPCPYPSKVDRSSKPSAMTRPCCS